MQMSERDLTGDDFKVRSSDEVGQAMGAFNVMRDTLISMITRVKNGTENLRSTTAVINDSVEQNSQGSRKISDAVDTMLEGLKAQARLSDAELAAFFAPIIETTRRVVRTGH